MWPFENKDAGETTPICLIHPDTVDRVREFLDLISKGIRYGDQQERAVELLKLLPEGE